MVESIGTQLINTYPRGTFMRAFRWPAVILLMIWLGTVTGCMSKNWQAPWKEGATPASTQESDEMLKRARDNFFAADDKESLLASMESYRAVLAFDPGNREALAYMGNQHILFGTAFSADRSEKRHHFQQAMKYCELAMYTNPAFKKEVDAGKKPWEAINSLQAEDAPAMLFWVTALQYEFKEVMLLPDKFANIGWMRHCIAFLDRIHEVAPDYGNGAVEFAYTICYCVLPEIRGGDEEKCHAYMAAAVAKGEHFLLPRWGRGKYFSQVTGDVKSSRADLEWVAIQDLARFKDPYPWRVHFKDDAQLRLSELQR